MKNTVHLFLYSLQLLVLGVCLPLFLSLVPLLPELGKLVLVATLKLTTTRKWTNLIKCSLGMEREEWRERRSEERREKEF